MKAIILAAGKGSRLKKFTENRPKCLLEVKNKPILAYQLEALVANGIRDVVIVVGYKSFMIKEFIRNNPIFKNLNIVYIENDEYGSSNSSYSWWLARDYTKNEKALIHLNSDLIFFDDLISRILKSKYENVVYIDKKIELNDSMEQVILKGDKIIEMDKRNIIGAHGKAVGVAKFSKEVIQWMLKRIGEYIENGDKKQHFYAVIRQAVHVFDFYGIDIKEFFFREVNTQTDYKNAKQSLPIKKAIIFDFDGIIIDSEPIRYETYRKLFMDNYSINLPSRMSSKLIGRTQKENMKYFLDKYHFKGGIEELIRQRKRLLKEAFSKRENIKLIPGVLKLLKMLKKNGFRIAIASSSSKDYISRILKVVGLSSFFDLIVSGDMIKNSKPNPEIFITTANRLGQKKEDCIVIEDSINGILAAKRAGMGVIAITSSLKKPQLDIANKVVGRLDKIQISDIQLI